jgi:hypothetical protein
MTIVSKTFVQIFRTPLRRLLVTGGLAAALAIPAFASTPGCAAVDYLSYVICVGSGSPNIVGQTDCGGYTWAAMCPDVQIPLAPYNGFDSVCGFGTPAITCLTNGS